MNSIINAALSRTRTVVLLAVLLAIVGISSLKNIPRESFPDVTIPMAYVSVSYEGISPQDSDSMLVRPLEKELKSLEGLDEITSTASEGHASVTLKFDTSIDIDEALSDTREAVDKAKGSLPKEADDPTVNEINVALFPIFGISLAGEIDERVLKAVSEDLQEKLEALPGVLEATINGVREEVAEIVIDPQLMASYNLSHNELISLVSRNNQLVTAGNLDTGAGRFSVKVPGLIETEEDILNLPIKVDGTTVLRFKDIAFGQRSFKDRERISRVQGKQAVTLEIKKRVGENIIDTVDAVKQTVSDVQPYWPEGIEVSYFQDQSKSVKTQLSDLFNNVIFATILVFIVIIWALGPRSALLVGIAIPASFLAGIVFLNLMGYTLNMVVLFALILTVGMLVDGAIVVTEYADRRMNEGADNRSAYREAATRMSWPIISSTITTLVVFMPLLFWPGIMGEFMKFLPITVIATLGSSLVVALIIIPTFGFLIGKPSPLSDSERHKLNAIAHGDLSQLTGVTRYYTKSLKVALAYPLTTILLVICFAASVVGIFVSQDRGVQFFPESDTDFGSIAVRARGNLSLSEKDVIIREVEDRILNLEEVATVFTKTSAVPLRDYAEDAIGVIQVEMVDWQQRRETKIILEEIVTMTSDIPGIIIEKSEAMMGPTSGIDIQIEFASNDRDALKSSVIAISRMMTNHPDLADVSDNLPLNGIEWQIDVDRESASRFGADMSSVGSSIRMITNGLKVGSYRPDNADDELDIRLRYPYNGRDLDQIDDLSLTVQGQQVPLSNFITRNARNKQGEIYRTDGKLSLKIEANVKEGLKVDKTIEALGEILKSSYEDGTISPKVTFKFAGDQEEQQETGAFLGSAFMVAIFLMIVVLVTQFNSLYQTALILSAIIFSTAGVFLGLLITGEQFGIVMSGVGLIALAGIVVNNNIVLIDTFNVVRRQNIPAHEAALLACSQRLRPIFLTTITTILGLVPMVLQWNIDIVSRGFTVGAPSSQMWTQLSTSIAGGLAYTAILTLFLTPTLLVLKERRVDRKKAKGNWQRSI